jgi:nucleotide-binding universal stress UspA family protein
MRVLFPTDGSKATESAFDNLLELLGEAAEQAEITVFNVTDEGFEVADHEYVEETFEDDERDEVFPSEEASRRAVDRCVRIGKEHGVDVATKIVEGTYKDEILEEAGRHDVLAMHELRSSNWKDRLLGSATEKLTRNAQCSVLLVEIDEID